MQNEKKVGLGLNNQNTKLFYILLVTLPSLQFLFFYVFVNFNSFLLAFKLFEGGNITKYNFGWDNFSKWFTDDVFRADLTAAIGVSLKSYVISFVISVPLGLFFSYYMFKRMPGSKLFRILLFMPSIISGAVLAAIFKQATALALGGGFGLFKEWFGVSINFWDAEHKYASTMFFNIFASFGTSVLMYTNKMDSIDPEMVESAHLDGADGVKEFWYIILPQAFSIVQVFLMTGFAGIFSNQLNALMLFDYEVGREIQTVGYMLWRGVARAGGNVTQMGRYAALGLMITILIVPLTFLLRWTMQKVGWKEE